MPEETSGPGNPPEDELDRKLRELTENRMGEAKYKELTAAERAQRAARYRRQVQRDLRAMRRRGRRGRLLTGVIAVFVLAGLGSVAWLRFGHSQAGPAAGVSSAAVPGTGGAAPTDPFAGNVAGTWADGASGITVPVARPAGTFTAAQVQDAYASTRKLLIAANLNQQTLLGGAPTAFAGLLTKAQRGTFLAGLNTKGVNKSGYPLSTRKWVASFAPGSTDFIGNVVKVHGTMSAHAVNQVGGTILAVQVNYLFAYGVEPPGRPGDWMRVIDHQYGSFNFARWDDPGGALEPWDQTIIGNAGILCGTQDGYIHPAYPSLRPTGATQSGPAVNPYSPATAVPGGGAVCGQTSGA